MKYKVIKVNPENRNIILSIRRLQEEQKQKVTEQYLKEYQKTSHSKLEDMINKAELLKNIAKKVANRKKGDSSS